ncbi:MarR family winged helix-turn-helix transcriptional regulator [Magnetospirillum sp. SS-4]|uniref:MarR family winged helix-turn-helix transcriptional regulator n=1 Tax=Magnetospirillum sp. SS-4 TaxID=2681465 RepID=UPI001382685F|nr:MarR family transcriptional regulator [Magnetospirillum sp. SS-4]CAA7620884.1 MarR family transcriptional regulator [Magnetospirillum sp. SS-4]
MIDNSNPDGGNTKEGLLPIRAWLALFSAVKQIEAVVRINLRESFDSTLPRFDLLSQLYRAPDGMTMGELSNRLMVTNGNVTGLIARLAGEGLVERLQDSGDRRVQRVRLSPKGRRLFDDMAPANQAWISSVMAGLSEEELRQLHGLLGKLRISVAASPAARRGGGGEPA